MRTLPFLLAAGCLLAALPVTAGIYRCTAPAGAVTYQETPCQAEEATRILEVPSSYPAADHASHEQVLAREAALDQRLEARRERESREQMARVSQPAAPASDASADSPAYWIVGVPYARSHAHAQHRAAGHRMPNHG